MAEFDKAGIGLCILSFLFPIVGIILYFVKKNEEPNAAKTYLSCGIGGFALGLLITFL
jgi:hypothetical protein